MKFKNAVNDGDVFKGHCKDGRKALKGSDKNLVKAVDSRRISGSLDMDEAWRIEYPNAPRWDYCIGYDLNGGEVVYYLEVHPAETSEVSSVIEKARFLRKRMPLDAHSLWDIRRSLVWVASGRINIPPKHARKRKQLASEGVKGPERFLTLGK
ncbi:MAG: hypothetical protein U9Q00_01320 [Synergistota bacterium]|nr:hypothetical protein [Synergistota bacterium]